MKIRYGNDNSYGMTTWIPISHDKLIEAIKLILNTTSCIIHDNDSGIKPDYNFIYSNYDSFIVYGGKYTLFKIIGPIMDEDRFMGKSIHIYFDGDKIECTDNVTVTKQLTKYLNIPLVISLHFGKWVRDYWQIIEPNGEQWAVSYTDFIKSVDELVEGSELDRSGWIKLEDFKLEDFELKDYTLPYIREGK